MVSILTAFFQTQCVKSPWKAVVLLLKGATACLPGGAVIHPSITIFLSSSSSSSSSGSAMSTSSSSSPYSPAPPALPSPPNCVVPPLAAGLTSSSSSSSTMNAPPLLVPSRCPPHCGGCCCCCCCLWGALLLGAIGCAAVAAVGTTGAPAVAEPVVPAAAASAVLPGVVLSGGGAGGRASRGRPSHTACEAAEGPSQGLSKTWIRSGLRARLEGCAMPSNNVTRSLPYRGQPALQRAAFSAAVFLRRELRQAVKRACCTARAEASTR
mmetsp:Transcript_27051/g.69698  ORF Transcript_27051/g.69698 Transcript_27051/m.69698 type:complete len:267 (+) Transcript_27051:2983-3783(+)